MSVAGGCRCSAIRYEVAVEALPLSYACHCRDCQTWSGSGFALHAMLPESLFTLSGAFHQFQLEGVEAMLSDHVGCAACSTRIANRNGAIPNMIILRAGTLDRSDELVPAVHIWTKRKQAWLAIPQDSAAFEESPTPEQFATAIQKM